MEKIIKKYKLNEEPDDLEYWLSKSYSERIKALESLKENYIKFFLNGHNAGFQRVYIVIK
jgi:hypothetical protein